MSRATNTRVTPGYVEGTALAPYVEISIDFGAKMPGGGGLQNWVKNLPGRSWDPSTKTWRITGTGISKHPQDVFDKAGIELIWPEDGELADLDLEDLWDPVIVEDSFSSEAQVYPRFSGFEYVQQKIGPGAVWDKKNLCFNVRITDLIDGHGRYWPGLTGPKHLRTQAEDMFEPMLVPPRIADIAYQLAGDTGTDPDTEAGADGQKPMSPRVRKLITEISDFTGKLPDWFGLNLYPFQEAGAYAAAAGHSMIVDPPGLGKGSPVSTRILTPAGWSTYGEIKVGDRVIGKNGQATRVIGVYPRGELEVFRVTMNDGSSVVVDGDHLWEVRSKEEKAEYRHPRVRSTRELMTNDLKKTESIGHTRHINFIPMVEPVCFDRDETPLPLHPYVLGILLGDGHIRRTPAFTSADQWIVDRVDALLPKGYSARPHGNPVRLKESRRTASYGISRSPLNGARLSNEVGRSLDRLGLVGTLSHTKFVPSIYMFATPEERLELLRGILDADGHAGAALEYSTASPLLADDVQFLVESLGGQVRRTTKIPTYRNRHKEKVEGRLSHRMILTLPPETNPFALPRKADAWKAPFKYGPMRAISSIESVGRDEVVCIAVEAMDQLYVTENFIVTHNTRQGLAVAAIHGAKRVLVICPPLVLSNWAHEASTALGPGFDPRKVPAPPKRGKATPYGTAVFYPGRKFPELPEEGIVIVAYSMLAARPELLQQVREWNAETLIVDESHLLRGWDSARGAVVRKLAGELEAGVRVPMTGTPILSTPEQLVNQLAISGHLDPVFGGASAFMEEYTSPDKFGGRRVLKKKLSQLHEILDEEVWVRRNKNEVLTQLPDKSRAVRYVDIDNRAFEKAHKELYAIIAEWVNDPATEYSIEAAEEWARENIGLISPLRVAAGMAKVPVAIETIADWMEQTTTTVKGKKVYDRPLTVWAHHTVVLNALADSMDPKVAAFGVIDSSTSPQERARLVDEYQAGNIGVLFCKIIAAGFGITLTRGSDPLFVETEWSNSNVSQAEDRHHRIGQVHPVIATTLVAPDTLDPMIRAVQRRKTEILNEVLVGGDNDVANSDFIVNSDGVYEEIPDDERLLEKEYTSQYDVIIRIAEEIHAKKKPRRRSG